VVIVENHIDYSFRDWGADVSWNVDGSPNITLKPIEKPAHRQGKINILWSGGSTHQLDLEEIGPSLRMILNKYPHVRFCFYGSPQMYEQFVTAYKLPREQTEHIPPRHFLDYPGGLHGFDIGLAPIHGSQFNCCKSFLRLEELGAVGVASIASNVGPYTRFSKRHPGLVSLVGRGVGNFSSWGAAIEYFIQNPEEMEKRKQMGRQIVAEHYSLEANFGQWYDAWALIAERRAQGQIGPPEDRKEKAWYRSYGRLGRNDPCECGSGVSSKRCCVEAWGAC
jgi:glycosyltransferase involved in cell wall biosynthesis